VGGEGKGDYPTIQPFGFSEEITFRNVGKPFLVYDQRTWSLEDRRPLHSEMGYWRPKPGGRVEIVLAESTGHAEVLEGDMADGTLTVVTASIARAGTAKEVVRVERSFRFEDDTIRYTLSMEAVGQPLTGHLEAVLTRRG
jgi:hypothetical protein